MRLRGIFTGIHFCLGALLIALLVYPIRSGGVRLLIVCSASAFLIGLSMWIRNRRVRWGFLGILLLTGLAIALLPGESVDKTRLRTQYVDRYEGHRYVWGGENGWGVDCSGILRAAWIDSQLCLGIRTGNPRLIRGALSAWWFDARQRRSFASDLAAGLVNFIQPKVFAPIAMNNSHQGILRLSRTAFMPSLISAITLGLKLTRELGKSS